MRIVSRNRVITGAEIRALSTRRGPFLDARRTFSFASSNTVPAGLDLVRGGMAWWPARGLVRPA